MAKSEVGIYYESYFQNICSAQIESTASLELLLFHLFQRIKKMIGVEKYLIVNVSYCVSEVASKC